MLQSYKYNFIFILVNVLSLVQYLDQKSSKCLIWCSNREELQPYFQFCKLIDIILWGNWLRQTATLQNCSHLSDLVYCKWKSIWACFKLGNHTFFQFSMLHCRSEKSLRIKCKTTTTLSKMKSLEEDSNDSVLDPV